MLSSIWKWINERWPLDPLVRWAVDEKIPGGSSFVYSDGSAILTVFAIQAVTGIIQLLFYVPSVDHAYDSIAYLRTQVPFGWLIHGLHYWGANVMIIVVALHMSRAFTWGAYKKPRELIWLLGVTLVLTVMAFSFTGAPLHWDQRGYWAGEVGTSIAGTTPIVGDLAKRLLRGGEEMGPLMLSRFFVAHTVILPAALGGLFVMHFIAFRRFGAVGPWYKWKEKFGQLWPDQIFRDMVLGSVIFYILISLAVFLPPAYSGQADTLDTSYIPKPEWNFLFLYQALKYFQGPLEPVGAVGVPALLVSLLVILPFIDRNPERSPLKRPVAMMFGIAFWGVIIALSLIGYYSPGLAGASANVKSATASAGASRVLPGGAEKAVPEDTRNPGRAAYVIGSAERGLILFANNCSSCHGDNGAGRGIAPRLKPISPEFAGGGPKVFAENIDKYIQHGSPPESSSALRMPAFGDTGSLTQQEIANIEAYITGLNGVDRATLINPGMRPRRFFIAVSAIYILIILIQGGIRVRRNI